MSATISQQIAAVDIARRIVTGGTKPPRPASSEAKLLAEQLTEASNALRAMQEKTR